MNEQLTSEKSEYKAQSLDSVSQELSEKALLDTTNGDIEKAQSSTSLESDVGTYAKSKVVADDSVDTQTSSSPIVESHAQVASATTNNTNATNDQATQATKATDATKTAYASEVNANVANASEANASTSTLKITTTTTDSMGNSASLEATFAEPATRSQDFKLKITLPQKPAQPTTGPSSFKLDQAYCKQVGDWKLNMNDEDTLRALLPSQKRLSIAKYIKNFAYHTGKLVSPVGNRVSWDVTLVSNKLQETMQHTYFAGADKTLEDIFPKRYSQPSIADLSQRYVLDNSINVGLLYKGYLRPIAIAYLDERTYEILMPKQIAYLEPNEDLNPILKPTQQYVSNISRFSFNSNFTAEYGPKLPESAYLPYQPFKVESEQKQPSASACQAIKQPQSVDHFASNTPKTPSDQSASNTRPFVASIPNAFSPMPIVQGEQHSVAQQSNQGAYVPLSYQVNSQLAQTLEIAPQNISVDTQRCVQSQFNAQTSFNAQPRINTQSTHSPFQPQFNQATIAMGQEATPDMVQASQAPSMVYGQMQQGALGQGTRQFVPPSQLGPNSMQGQQFSKIKQETSFNGVSGVNLASEAAIGQSTPQMPVQNGSIKGAFQQSAGISVLDRSGRALRATSFMQWATLQREASGYDKAVQELASRNNTVDTEVSLDGGYVLDIASLSFLAQHAMPQRSIKLPWLKEMCVLVKDPFD